MTTDLRECFVVMPFGTKPIPDSGGREYDFDKVYRVLIRPAIESAGLIPHRADQTLSSGPIHTDMFRALRDRPLVLADLSLLNPNVFYEVGIRHVLSRCGTVLMCGHLPGEKLSLPFDIALSRVVAYEYDGMRLDWEVVESVRTKLREILEATGNTVDSPLHSLLTDVWVDAPSNPKNSPGGRYKVNQREFQAIIAEHWKREARGGDRKKLENLLREERYRSEAFAISAIGYYCLSLDRLPPIANQVAEQLRLVEQYEVADQLYKKLLRSDALKARELANYASVHSEVEVTLARTDSAITLADKAIRLAKRRGAGNGAGSVADQAYCMFVKAGLLEWRARRWGTPEEASETVERFREVIEIWQKAGPPADDVDDLARVHLKMMYLLRRIAGDNARLEEQRHGDAILALNGDSSDKETRSWLAWYQAIVQADRGNTEAAQRIAITQSAIDRDEPADTRGRRHSLVRRLINDNADVRRNSAGITKLTQLLDS